MKLETGMKRRLGMRMAAWATLLCLALAVVGCGEKKQATAAEEQAAYDYRTALQNYQIGVNYLNNDDPLKAMEHLQKAVALDSDNFRYFHSLALAYSLNGQLEEALEAGEKSVAINPDFSECHNLMGSIYIDLGRYEEALSSLKKVILDQSYPQPQFAYFNLGIALRRQGREDEAIAAFTQATRLDPEFHRAYVALAEIYRERGEFRLALNHYQKAESGYNNNVDLLFQIGQAHFKLRQFDEAKSYLAQVSILFPPPNIDEPTQAMLRYIEAYQRESRD